MEHFSLKGWKRRALRSSRATVSSSWRWCALCTGAAHLLQLRCHYCTYIILTSYVKNCLCCRGLAIVIKRTQRMSLAFRLSRRRLLNIRSKYWLATTAGLNFVTLARTCTRTCMQHCRTVTFTQNSFLKLSEHCAAPYGPLPSGHSPLAASTAKRANAKPIFNCPSAVAATDDSTSANATSFEASSSCTSHAIAVGKGPSSAASATQGWRIRRG